jgi:energy-coupling factor transporter ATP-binding protein EcfA2
MGEVVLIYGKSGSGKSRSLKNFGEDEILLVNVEGKQLPFRKKFKYTLNSDSVDQIVQQIQKMPCKVAVIDDAGYLMTHIFMSQHRTKMGNASFEMYDDIADTMYRLIKAIKNPLVVDNDKIVYIVLHEDTDDYGNVKFKTIGKLIDNKVCMEGMVTMCIRCMSDEGKHFFRVRTDGSDITKTPEDMFATAEIDNDLKLVDDTIREYYGIEVKKDGKTKGNSN